MYSSLFSLTTNPTPNFNPLLNCIAIQCTPKRFSFSEELARYCCDIKLNVQILVQKVMNSVGLAQLIVFMNFIAPITANQGDCPTWFFPDADNGTGCVCSSAAEGYEVKCSQDTAILWIGVCMTCNRVAENTEIGEGVVALGMCTTGVIILCPCIYQGSYISSDNFFPLSNIRTSNLTSFMCESHQRESVLSRINQMQNPLCRNV